MRPRFTSQGLPHTVDDVDLSLEPTPLDTSPVFPSRLEPTQMTAFTLSGSIADQWSSPESEQSLLTPPPMLRSPLSLGRDLTPSEFTDTIPKCLADELSDFGPKESMLSASPTLPTSPDLLHVAPSKQAAVTPALFNREVESLLEEVAELRIFTKYQSLLLKEYEKHDRLDTSWVSSASVSSEASKIQANRTHCEGKWIGGVWLSLPEDKALLGEAEACWGKRESQRAMAILSVIILSDKETKENKVKAQLLKGVVLRDCGQKNKALGEVEAALAIATKYMLWQLMGVAQFQRGICLFHLDRFPEASFCFTLAAYAKNHEEQVSIYKELSEKMRVKLKGHLKFVHRDFNEADTAEVETD